jgi:hypothetical protein
MRNNKIDLHIKKQYALQALKWCQEYLGKSTRKRRKLKLYITEWSRTMDNGKSIVFGNYCFYRNRVSVYATNCETIEDVVGTVIHEYTHYLQSRPQYEKYAENYHYSTNPYEKEAKRNEKKYTKVCIKEIKKLI